MIIDGHAHMFTVSILKDMSINLKKTTKEFTEAPKYTIKENVDAWIAAMDKNKIDKTVFMATTPLNKDFISFINSSTRFVGLAKIDPTKANAVMQFKKELKAGMKGAKLYATNDGFDVSSKKAYPFYKFCQKNNIPIVIHFGVTIGSTSNLTTGNPLLLSNVLKDFPELKFVIAHFGAGFFREVLMLKYKSNNLYVDTSGTNNWLAYQDNFLTLKDVFKKTVEVFSAKNIIFGSDTRIFPDGYREKILIQQVDILDELDLSKEDINNVMQNNAKHVFNI